MAIVTLSESSLNHYKTKPGAILRDSVLCGLCVRVGRRHLTFFVATSTRSKQVRVTLGRWPLVTVCEARELALPILKMCRAGEMPVRPVAARLPNLCQALAAYAAAKKVKSSSLARYQSLLKTHFRDWLEQPVSALKGPAFAEHCHSFAQTKGAAIVELGRGLIGSLLRYLHAVHGLDIPSPFIKLGAAGLLPARAQPRARKLKEADLPTWLAAVDKLPELQRDYLHLVLLTGLRKNECGAIRREHVDLAASILLIPDTKTKKPHTLPITAAMREILERRCKGLEMGAGLFSEFSVDHVTEMARRAGAPEFTLHDLRKMLATVGAKLDVGDAILRRILNHAAKRSDVLHRHYVSLDMHDVVTPLAAIQAALVSLTAGELSYAAEASRTVG